MRALGRPLRAGPARPGGVRGARRPRVRRAHQRPISDVLEDLAHDEQPTAVRRLRPTCRRSLAEPRAIPPRRTAASRRPDGPTRTGSKVVAGRAAAVAAVRHRAASTAATSGIGDRPAAPASFVGIGVIVGVHRRHRDPRRAAQRSLRTTAAPLIRTSASGAPLGEAGGAVRPRRVRRAAAARHTACTACGGQHRGDRHPVDDLAGEHLPHRDGQRHPARASRSASSSSPSSGRPTSVSPRGQVDPHRLVGEPGRGHHVDQHRPVARRPARPPRPARGRAVASRVLPRHVEQPGRQLPQPPAHRVPVLLDHHQPVVVVERDDRDRPGVLDDLPDGDAARRASPPRRPAAPSPCRRRCPASSPATGKSCRHRATPACSVIPTRRRARRAGSSTGSRSAAR